jgi:hypothetical protein
LAKIRLPRIDAPLPAGWTRIPSPSLCAMTFPAPSAVPPIVASAEPPETTMP